jgi:hypothetical protein
MRVQSLNVFALAALAHLGAASLTSPGAVKPSTAPVIQNGTSIIPNRYIIELDSSVCSLGSLVAVFHRPMLTIKMPVDWHLSF